MARQAIRILRAASIFGLLLLVSACNDKGKAAPQGPQALPVKVQDVKASEVGEFTEYLATIKSWDSSVLQPQVEGQITHIFVKPGDHVTEGEPLFQIDPLKQQATVNTQEASEQSKRATLAFAQQDLARKKQLASQGVISKQDLDQAQAAYDAAKADVEATGASVREQQEQLKYYRVKAPTAGTVGDIPVRVGDRVTVSTVLTTLDRGGELDAYISIPAEKASQVKKGMKVEFLDDSGKVVGESAINFISPRIDTDNQLLLVKAPAPDNRFRNAQVVHVRVVWSEKQAPTVPVLAVSRVSGEIFAFVVENQNGQTVARQRQLKVGDIVGNDYVVLDGVKPGDRLIVSGVQMLTDGMPVMPQS